ncbi:MAG: PRC-barrel domain-containing protein, partial [Selenomonadaceae bacterium]|nr:PRC-barrel domain-containing protein [Selenomonadaceae bacterium]
MKKSVEILGLPIISITEGRELGVSKTLLIDAKNGAVAAITIEDDDWYRGVKLIPYESIIAIGEDAVTITHSENILTLDEAGDYERLLDENIRVIGTKAITRNGRIQGKVTEVFIGDGGKIEKCEITAPDGSVNDVGSEQISIFGKQVTVVDVDDEKKNSLTENPAFEPAFETFKEPVQEVWTPAVEESPIEEIQHELPPPEVNTTSPEEQAALEEVMTPEPAVEEVAEPVVEEVAEPAVEEVAEPAVEEVAEPAVEEVAEPAVEEVAEPAVEEVAEPAVEEVAEPAVEEVAEPAVEEVAEPA